MLVTQEDSFYIPKLISLLLEKRSSDIVGITILPGEMSNKNILKYIKFMGLIDFTRYVFLYSFYNILNFIFRKGLKENYYSVAAVGKKYNLPVYYPKKVNSEVYYDILKKHTIDLIVSIAAPQIFKKELLNILKHGCINIHNALIPKYQGVLPSFWVLANNEEYTGVTVHYMNEAIDAGDIILQKKVKILPEDTLHSLVYRTKITIGPKMLIEAIDQIEQGNVKTTKMDMLQATYFSFPDDAAVKRFRKLKRKFR